MMIWCRNVWLWFFFLFNAMVERFTWVKPALSEENDPNMKMPRKFTTSFRSLCKAELSKEAKQNIYSQNLCPYAFCKSTAIQSRHVCTCTNP